MSGAKYAYLVVFFALLAGLFHPVITGGSFDSVVSGILVLFLGLAGGALLYKSTNTAGGRTIYLGMGLGLIALSLYLVLTISGRV
ncbi:hypothetical protein CENSYa_1852 [Cenarchaeum symbiosum A]|uniref:Transmembrane protein n=1 Tax=Cenarchaeum symbiosum (strain A) TaxID=414004 RepID=A0RYP5_CENSY|nr:hypothetical protein CENSYa_1852 [Cenarchaeum symbiosum A]